MQKFVKIRVSAISSLLSLSIGVYVIGLNQIWFSNSEWLTNRSLHVDAKSAQISWNFFRHTKILQFPVTKNQNFGFGSETLFQTSAGSPFLGVPLKFFDFLLPQNFQYIGLWLALCFLLQGYFSSKIISLKSNSSELIIVGSLFFTLAPIFIHRVGIMGQLDMGAHWILLAALYLYFLPDFSIYRWSLTNFAALFLGPYLAVMVFGIFFSSIIKNNIQNQFTFRRNIPLIVLPTAAFAAAFFVLGYHTYGGQSLGPGFFRLNLGAFFYPVVSHSSVSYAMASRLLGGLETITSRPFIAYEGEGFNFVGLGMVVFSPFLLLFVFRMRRSLHWSMHLPILAISLLFLFFAFSNQLAIGRREVILPSFDVLENVRSIFRSATRFAWPATYLFLTYGLFAIVSMFKRRTAGLLLVSILFLQLYDSTPLYKDAKRVFHDEEQGELLNSDFWQIIGNKSENLVLYPTFDYVSDGKTSDQEYFFEDLRWLQLVQFASVYGLRTNFVFSGRPMIDYIDLKNSQTLTEFSRNVFTENSIYIIKDETLWRSLQARNTNQNRMHFYFVDGYYLLLTD